MSHDPSQSPNQFQKTPSPTPQERIAQFIAAVERSLSEAGVSNDERQNVTADLRVQIEEMLSARTEGKTPTLEDVQAVLSELDPPESYSETATRRIAKAAGNRRILLRTARWAISRPCSSPGSLGRKMVLASPARRPGDPPGHRIIQSAR